MRRLKRLKIALSLFLVFTLLFCKGSGFAAVYAEEISPQPAAATAPPKEEKPPSESQPSSAPAESAPAKEESPTSPPSSPSESSSGTTQPATSSGSNSADSTGIGPSPAGANHSPPSPGFSTPTNSPSAHPNTVNILAKPSGNPLFSPTPGFEAASASTSGQSKSLDDPSNILTGPLSTNSGSLTNSNTDSVTNENQATVANEVNATSITGNNHADFNTLTGSVASGNSTVGVNVMNKLNANFTGVGGIVSFDIYDNHEGDIVLAFPQEGFSSSNSTGMTATGSGGLVQNVATGPGSTNAGKQSDTNSSAVANTNDATVTNNIKVSADTGHNSASYNTLGGSIKTGNANAFANVINFVNTSVNAKKWLVGVVNIFGKLTGNIILPGSGSTAEDAGSTQVVNSNTGPLSTNTASSSATTTNSTQNSNSAKVINKVNAVGETGKNDASMNTLGGEVTTGVSTVNVNENTVANTNAQGDTVWLVIVNQMGNWMGYIVGAPLGVTSASSANLPIVSGNPTDPSYVGNNVTGPLSQNTGSLSKETTTSTTNSNQAVLVNNIDVVANTGKNDAKLNTGPGSIQTGNAKASVNLFNMVNTNIVAKKFVAVLVNVFGDFLGAIVPPDQKAPSEKVTYETGGFTQTSSSPFVTSSPSVLPAIGGSNFNGLTQASDQPKTQTSQKEETRQGSLGTTTVQTVVLPAVQAVNPPSQSNSTLATHSFSLSSQSIIVTHNYSLTARENVQTPQTYVLGETFPRGTFVSRRFVLATGNSGSLLLLGGYEIDRSWLIFIPLAFLIFLLRRRYIVPSIRHYTHLLMEIIL